ncbi:MULTISPECIES: hypothetical protein [unclassified Wolbachia]|nr:hypothetical protein [Wolbachia endosymbiont (group A) of Apoderus coryli]
MFIAKRAQERCYSSAPMMSFQCLTLESSSYCTFNGVNLRTHFRLLC